MKLTMKKLQATLILLNFKEVVMAAKKKTSKKKTSKPAPKKKAY